MPLSQEDFADVNDNELFRAIKLQKWDKTQQLLEGSHGDQLIRDCDTYGNTALHSAIGYKAPDELLLAMIDMYPEATTVHGTEDWTPLHVASMWGCSSRVMTAIIRANPAALDDAGQGGIKGRTPRHFSDRFPHNKELLDRPTDAWIACIEEEKNSKDT